jgi:hypothetical protein
MIPVTPAEIPDTRLVVFAKDQPQYLPLPVRIAVDGTVVTEWEPTAEELALLVNGGRVRLTVLTFNNPLQPVRLDVTKEPWTQDLIAQGR